MPDGDCRHSKNHLAETFFLRLDPLVPRPKASAGRRNRERFRVPCGAPAAENPLSSVKGRLGSNITGNANDALIGPVIALVERRHISQSRPFDTWNCA